MKVFPPDLINIQQGKKMNYKNTFNYNFIIFLCLSLPILPTTKDSFLPREKTRSKSLNSKEGQAAGVFIVFLKFFCIRNSQIWLWLLLQFLKNTRFNNKTQMTIFQLNLLVNKLMKNNINKLYIFNNFSKSEVGGHLKKFAFSPNTFGSGLL